MQVTGTESDTHSGTEHGPKEKNTKLVSVSGSLLTEKQDSVILTKEKQLY